MDSAKVVSFWQMPIIPTKIKFYTRDRIRCLERWYNSKIIDERLIIFM
jgi:hypothetical protein